MLYADRLIAFYKDESSCVIQYNLCVLDIKKLTFKKEDKTVLSMYFQEKDKNVFLLRVRLDNSSELLEDIQIMIEDYSS